jgi:hypothetical protein
MREISAVEGNLTSNVPVQTSANIHVPSSLQKSRVLFETLEKLQLAWIIQASPPRLSLIVCTGSIAVPHATGACVLVGAFTSPANALFS